MSTQFEAEIVWLDPKSLTPYMNNAKIHTTEQIDKIAAQISYAGFDVPIVVDKSRVIIKGHGRREAAIRLGLAKVPVIVRDDLSENEVKAARVADNEVAKGEIDKDKLRFELGTLQGADFDLKLTGFDLGDIGKILDDDSESGQKDKQPKKDKEENGEQGEDGDGGDPAESQFIVTIHCKSEEEMKALYDELSGRDLSVKLIT